MKKLYTITAVLIFTTSNNICENSCIWLDGKENSSWAMYNPDQNCAGICPEGTTHKYARSSRCQCCGPKAAIDKYHLIQKHPVCVLPDYTAQGYKNSGRATPKPSDFPQTGEYLNPDRCPYIVNFENVWTKDGAPDGIERVILYRCKNAGGETATVQRMLLWSHCTYHGYNEEGVN